MKLKYKDIEHVLTQLNWTHPFTLCTRGHHENYDYDCEQCPFATVTKNDTLCNLQYGQNSHLPELVKTVKAKHPELFI